MARHISSLDPTPTMKILSTLLVASLLVALPSSCKSPEPNPPCVCGTEMGDLEGCTHPQCRDGHANPDNPKCVCGTIDIPKGK